MSAQELIWLQFGRRLAAPLMVQQQSTSPRSKAVSLVIFALFRNYPVHSYFLSGRKPRIQEEDIQSFSGEQMMSLFEKLEWLNEEQDACEGELERIADQYHAMGDFEEAIDALELLLEARELKYELGYDLRKSA